MSKLILGIRQSFLALYILLGLAYIVLIALPYRAAAVYYYLVLVIGLFVFIALTPYLRAVCTILDLSKSYLEIALKI